jgi:hypothetical protein
MASSAARIIEQAKHLPARERRRVVSALEASLTRPTRVAAGRANRGPSYEALLALAGTAHAGTQDVSANKYAHLAAVYADDDT